jgi:hypothetical protein
MSDREVDMTTGEDLPEDSSCAIYSSSMLSQATEQGSGSLNHCEEVTQESRQAGSDPGHMTPASPGENEPDFSTPSASTADQVENHMILDDTVHGRQAEKRIEHLVRETMQSETQRLFEAMDTKLSTKIWISMNRRLKVTAKWLRRCHKKDFNGHGRGESGIPSQQQNEIEELKKARDAAVKEAALASNKLNGLQAELDITQKELNRALQNLEKQSLANPIKHADGEITGAWKQLNFNIRSLAKALAGLQRCEEPGEMMATRLSGIDPEFMELWTDDTLFHVLMEAYLWRRVDYAIFEGHGQAWKGPSGHSLQDLRFAMQGERTTMIGSGRLLTTRQILGTAQTQKP